MALSASTVWEVRTTANDNNGGGYVTGSTGTDYSQQDSPQYALTGLASSGSGNVVLSASAANDMVGSIGQVISGTNFTTGFFQVASVVVGVSITFSTNGAGASICTGVGASGVINIGGAHLTVAKPISAWAAQNIVYVKAGSGYSISSTITLASSLNDLPSISPNAIIGYSSTRTDNSRATISTSSAIKIFTCNMNNVLIQSFVLDGGQTATYAIDASGASNPQRGFRCVNLIVQNGFTTRGIYAPGGVGLIYRCRTTGMKSGATAAFSFTQGQCVDSLADANACTGFSLEGSNALPCTFIRCIATANTGVGFTLSQSISGTTLDHCVAHNNTSDGAVLAGGSGYSVVAIINSIFVKNGGYGINFAIAQKIAYLHLNYNAFGSGGQANTSGAINNAFTGPNDITALSADPFTGAGSLDFSLNNNNPGGAQLRGTAFPGVSQFGTGSEDIGALRHADPAGSGPVGKFVFVGSAASW